MRINKNSRKLKQLMAIIWQSNFLILIASINDLVDSMVYAYRHLECDLWLKCTAGLHSYHATQSLVAERVIDPGLHRLYFQPTVYGCNYCLKGLMLYGTVPRIHKCLIIDSSDWISSYHISTQLVVRCLSSSLVKGDGKTIWSMISSIS